jgi:hypothetical protein
MELGVNDGLGGITMLNRSELIYIVYTWHTARPQKLQIPSQSPIIHHDQMTAENGPIHNEARIKRYILKYKTHIVVCVLDILQFL